MCVFVFSFYVCFGMIKTKKTKKNLNVLICIEIALYFKKYQKYFVFFWYSGLQSYT